MHVRMALLSLKIGGWGIGRVHEVWLSARASRSTGLEIMTVCRTRLFCVQPICFLTPSKSPVQPIVGPNGKKLVPE